MDRLRMVVAVLVAWVALACLPAWPAEARTNIGGTSGPGPGEELLAVVQQDLHRVDLLRVGAPAKVVQRIGRRGTGPGRLLLPEGAFVDADRTVWVSDSGNNRLQHFDRTGRSRAIVSDLGRFGRFAQPAGIAPGPDGEMYVADTQHDRIVVLDRRGRAIAAWGESGRAPGQMSRPHGVAVSPDGARVYVIDLVLPRIQAFTSRGEFIGATADGGGGIVNATAIATAGDEAVYLTDETLGRVIRFSPDLRPLTGWGGPHGSAPGSFYNPQGVAVDRTGRVWVVDYGNHRGETFTSSGRFLFAFEEGQIGVRKATSSSSTFPRRWLALVPALAAWGGIQVRRRSQRRKEAVRCSASPA